MNMMAMNKEHAAPAAPTIINNNNNNNNSGGGGGGGGGGGVRLDWRSAAGGEKINLLRTESSHDRSD